MRFPLDDLDNDQGVVTHHDNKVDTNTFSSCNCNKKDVEEKELHDIDMEKKRWTNRRRMAWTSLISMLIVTGVVLFTNIVSLERVNVLSDVITWFYFSCASIIGMYMGATTWASLKIR